MHIYVIFLVFKVINLNQFVRVLPDVKKNMSTKKIFQQTNEWIKKKKKVVRFLKPQIECDVVCV